eukprot:9737924-Heterocapsa_arctica.AAC.1
MGGQKRNIADSNERSDKQACPGQDVLMHAREEQRLGREARSSGSKGPMQLAIEVNDEGRDLGKQHEGGK